MSILCSQSSIQASLSQEASKTPDPGAFLHSSCSLTTFVVMEWTGKVAGQVFPLECELSWGSEPCQFCLQLYYLQQGAGTHSKCLRNTCSITDWLRNPAFVDVCTNTFSLCSLCAVHLPHSQTSLCWSLFYRCWTCKLLKSCLNQKV